MRHALLPVILLAAALPASAASQAVQMNRASLIESDGIPRISAGASIELLSREVVAYDTAGSLEATSYSGYLGCDLWRWLTVFGTLGSMNLDTLEVPGTTGSFDSDLRWSLGFQASIWHVDLTKPDYMRGRLSIGITTEYTDCSSADDYSDISWTDTMVALPVGYEIPNEAMVYWGVHSLYLYAGPAYSAIDGDVETPTVTVPFEQSHDFGALMGADIFAAPNLSLGGSMLYVDDLTVTASVRYHF